jgi:hypothetical protein
MTISHEKEILAIDYADKSIHCISLNDLQLKFEIHQSYGGTNSLALVICIEQTSEIIFTLDNTKIITASQEGSIKIFCLLTQQELYEFVDVHEGRKFIFLLNA